MRPKMAKQVMESLDHAIANLEQLREPLLLAIARDECPPTPHERYKDAVGKTVKNVSNKVVAIDIATTSILKIATDLHLPIDVQEQRVAAVPDCIACGELALPRPKRALCGSCYDRNRNSKFTDIAEFIRMVKTEQEATALAEEEAAS
jgi:hypothetical protein